MKILLMVIVFLCRTMLTDEVKADNELIPAEYTDSVELHDGSLLIYTYCSLKSTLGIRKFHKSKCIDRKSQSYATFCQREKPSKHKKRSCTRLKKNLQAFHKTPLPQGQMRMLDRKFYRVCGGQNSVHMYHIKKSLCCGGAIIKTRPSHHKCCGKTVMNMSDELCCEGKRFVRSSDDQKCCGDQVYNLTTHGCFAGKTFEQEENELPRSYVSQFQKGNGSSFENDNNTNGFEQEYVTNEPSENLKEVDNLQTDYHSVTSFFSTKVFVGVIIGALLLFCALVFVIFPVVIYRLKTKTNRNAEDQIESATVQSNTPICEISNNDNLPVLSEELTSDMRDENVAHSEDTGEDCATSTCASSYPETEGSARSQQSVKQRQRYRSESSLHSTITLRLEDLVKNTPIDSQNLTANLVKDSSTQTSEAKETNRRDMFGNPFKLSCHLTKQTPHVRLNNSDASMTLSGLDLKDTDIEVHASSHTNLVNIRRAMEIKDDCSIISPCMEYDLPTVKKLRGHAVVELKLACNTSEKIQIWRYCRDQDSNSRMTVEVPVVKVFDNLLDTCCVVHNNNAYVYTKVFSTFVCTEHNTKRKINISGVLYAKTQIEDKTILRLTLYLVETLHIQITDYKAELDRQEACYGSVRKDHNRVRLPAEVTEEDTLVVELTINDKVKWDFITDPDDSLDSQEYACHPYPLCDICDQDKDIDFARSTWDIEKKAGTQDVTFQGHLYVRIENDKRQMAEKKRKRVFTVNETVKPHSIAPVRGEYLKSMACSFDQRPRNPYGELDSALSSDPYQNGNYVYRSNQS